MNLATLVAPAAVIAGSKVTDFRQASNNFGQNPVPGDVEWINSIIQSSNSVYFEGMSVPQRTVFTGIDAETGDIHTLTFDHQNTKAGIHAYDWLTSYDQAIQAAINEGFPYLDLNADACGPNIGPPGTLGATCLALRASSYTAIVNVPDDPFISKDGSTQSRINAYEAAYGNRTIKLYGNQPITAAALTMTHSVANGADTGDSDAKYVLTWTSASTNLLIEMAGHLAITGDGTGMSWGPGLGSSQISGGPYHFNLRLLDGDSLGAQDNQIKGADIKVPPDLQISKTADASPVNAGDPIGFTITVTNAGSGTATAATLNDPLPGGTGIDWSISPPYSGPGTCSITGSPPNETLACAFGDLAASASASVHVTSSTAFASCATYSNTATADASNDDPITATDDVTVECADLRVVKDADPVGPVSAGDAIGFDITVYNDGPGTAKDVTLYDELPGVGLTWSLDPAFTGCTITANVLECSFGDLADDASVGPIHVTATTSYAECTTYDNTATASASNAPDADDDASVSCDTPSLTITKTPDGQTVLAGATISFSITVTNNGPGTAYDVEIDDVLPGTGLTWTEVVDKAECTITGGNVLHCDVGDLIDDASFTVAVQVVTTSAACGILDNTAYAIASNHPEVYDPGQITVECPSNNLFHTGTTCRQYLGLDPPGVLAGTEITDVFYGFKNNKILNTAPGVFFYYNSFTAAGGGAFQVKIDQSTVGPAPVFGVQQNNQIIVYDASCNIVHSGFTISVVNGDAFVNFTSSVPGATYIVSVKYDTSTVVGTVNPLASQEYFFSTVIGAVETGSDSLFLTRK